MNDTLQKMLWVHAALLAATLPHIGRLPVWVLGLLAFCAMLSLRSHIRGGQPLRGWVRLGLVIGGVAGILLSYGTIHGLEAGSALLAVMMALKLLETRRPRDRVVLLFIAYFLILAAFLRRETLMLSMYLLGAGWLTTAALVQGARSGSALDARDLLSGSGRLLLGAVPVMVVLFLLFPRLSGPLWGDPERTTGVTGLSEHMSPGDVSSLSLSDELVFRARFSDATPPPQQLYWRALVLDHFDGRSWSFSRDPRPAAQGTQPGAPAPSVDYELIMEPHGQPWIFALDLPAPTDEQGVRRADDLTLSAVRPVHQRRRLQLAAYLDAIVEADADEARLAGYLQWPAQSNPRARALGQELADAADSPEEVVAMLLHRFAEQAYFYTLEPPALGSDAVDEFLFETRQGFCEHYASAFAAVMRAAGIPARVVLGYQGGELNPLSGFHLVRQYDAHAWTEVWLPEQGWKRVDPVAAVAPERVSMGLLGAMRGDVAFAGRGLQAPRWLQRGLLAWDATNTWWHSRVVGYDHSSQRRLLAGLGLDPSEHAGRAGAAAVLVALLLVLLSAMPHAGLPRLRRKPSDALLWAWERACLRLDRAGLPRRPWEGPDAYAQRIAGCDPQLVAGFPALARRYARLRYEPGAVACTAQQRELVRALRRLRPSARARRPLRS